MSTKTLCTINKQTDGGNRCAACYSSIISYSGSHCSDKKEVHFTLPDSSGYSSMEYFKKPHLKLRELVKPTEAKWQQLSVWLSLTPTDHTKPGFRSWLALWKHIPLQTHRLLIFCVCLSPNKKAVGISWQREQPWKDIKVTKTECSLTLSCPPLAEKVDLGSSLQAVLWPILGIPFALLSAFYRNLSALLPG